MKSIKCNLPFFEEIELHAFADLACIVDADIFLHSHTHLPLIFKQAFFRVSGQNSSVALTERLFVNTGSSLDYGGYGDKQGYKPASKKSPVIHLSGTKREMWAVL